MQYYIEYKVNDKLCSTLVITDTEANAIKMVKHNASQKKSKVVIIKIKQI